MRGKRKGGGDENCSTGISCMEKNRTKKFKALFDNDVRGNRGGRKKNQDREA